MRNRICCVMVFLLSIVLSSCGGAGSDGRRTTDAGTAIEEEWKTAYQNYLDKLYKDCKNPDKRLFYFCRDVDQNGIPELFVIDWEREDEDQMRAYTYQNGVEEIGSRLITGTTMLLYSEDPSCPGIFTFGVGGGRDWYGYMTVQDGRLCETELWNIEVGEEEGRERKEVSSDKRLIRESEKAYQNKAYRRIHEFQVKPENDIRKEPLYDPAKMKSIRTDHAKQKVPEKHKAANLNIKKEEPCIQGNNNRMNGNFVLPYKEGYFYDVEKNSDSVVVYQDKKGNREEQRDMCLTRFLYETNGFVYFYDDDKQELKRTRDGKTETILEFFYTAEMEKALFFAEDAIYYTDSDNETYLCKVDYDGKQKQELYKIDSYVEQIYKYGDELWFIYREPIGTGIDERNRLGKIDLRDDSMTVYQGIDPEGRLSFNNGYVYFNSKGFCRLNIREEYREQLLDKEVEAVNFTDDSLLFSRGKVLYRMDSDGTKEIKTLKGSTDGFHGIRVEDHAIYIGTYSGAFFSEISQIDYEGRTLKTIMKDEGI